MRMPAARRDTDLRFMEETPAGLRLQTWRWGPQMWVPGVTRKIQICVRCHDRFPVGTRMLHPLTNQKNREDRLCAACAQAIIKDARGR